MPNPPVDIAIALGSNLGDRLNYIRVAILSLDKSPQVSIVDFSSVYENKAHTRDNNDTQPPYLNAVVYATCAMSEIVLLKTCLRIESENGRNRQAGDNWRARTLDLDIIVYGHRAVDSKLLKIPHPHLADRRFVLQPLFEIRPDLHIPPPFDLSVRYLLTDCKDTGLLKLHTSRLSLFTPDEFARTIPSPQQ